MNWVNLTHMDYLFILTVTINALIFASIGTFILRMRHNALQKKSGNSEPYPMMKSFFLILIGTFVFLCLIGFLIAGKPW